MTSNVTRILPRPAPPPPLNLTLPDMYGTTTWRTRASSSTILFILEFLTNWLQEEGELVEKSYLIAGKAGTRDKRALSKIESFRPQLFFSIVNSNWKNHDDSLWDEKALLAKHHAQIWSNLLTTRRPIRTWKKSSNPLWTITHTFFSQLYKWWKIIQDYLTSWWWLN
jgi:hypothetical protein